MPMTDDELAVLMQGRRPQMHELAQTGRDLQRAMPFLAANPSYGLTPAPQPFSSDRRTTGTFLDALETVGPSSLPNTLTESRPHGGDAIRSAEDDNSWRQRLTRDLAGLRPGDRGAENAARLFAGDNRHGIGAVDAIPIASGIAQTLDTKEAYDRGDYGTAALNAAVTPLAFLSGPLARGAKAGLEKGAGAASRLVDYFRGAQPSTAATGVAGALTGTAATATPEAAEAARLPKLSPASVSRASQSAFQEALTRGMPKEWEHHIGMGARAASEPLSGGRIAQRRPTAAGATEDDTQNLLVNTFTLKQDPRAVEGVSNIIGGMPATTAAMREMAPTERIDAFQDFIKRNLTDTWDKMTPEQQRYYAQWYFGANRMAEENARKYGIPLTASSGNYAALSPQMDWNLNAHLGDRVLDILDRNPKATPDMLRLAPTLSVSKTNPAGVYGIEGRPEILAGFGDRPLLNMNPKEQALFMRLYDEAHGPKEYKYVLPSGERGEVVRNKDGSPAKPGWANFSNIEKAIQAATSAGDLKEISRLMGEAHKVRSFYNDIVNPALANKFGDATIDTHQIAGGLYYPLGGTHTYAGQGMGSAGPGSSVSGIHGLYPIYADATRQASLERNVPTLAMQSGPWEGIRSIMPASWRTNPNREAVDEIWRLVGEGVIPEQNARDMIYHVSGGIKFGKPPKS